MPFTVSYNGNGSDSGPVPSDLHGPYNPRRNRTDPDGHAHVSGKTGTAFAYWNTEPDGSGIIHGWPTDTSFVMPASNVVLYAQWFVTAGLSARGLTAHYAAAPRRRVHVAVPGAVRGRQGPNGGAPTATSWPTAPSGTGKHSQRSHNLHRPRWPGSGESPSDLSVRRTSRSVRRGRWTQGSHRRPRTGGSVRSAEIEPRLHRVSKQAAGFFRVRYGWPPMVAVPAPGASRLTTTRMVVDLPAPFGPMKPVIWPGRTVNVISSSACAGPNRTACAVRQSR